MTANTNAVRITAGPGQEIWGAAQNAFKGATVRFHGVRTKGNVRSTVQLEMQILGVMHEDGSGHNFLVSANILNMEDPAYRGHKVFYYSTQSCLGQIDLNHNP